MTSNVMDVAVIGGGPAGIFAAYRIALDSPQTRVILFDLGRPCGKRRRPGEGYFGMFPNSDGKLYQQDVTRLAETCGTVSAKQANRWFAANSKQSINHQIIKDPEPSPRLTRQIRKLGYELTPNPHQQLLPPEIHALSRQTDAVLAANPNVQMSFDNEIHGIVKHRNLFHVSSQQGDFVCRKLILAVGRSGWRWTQEIFEQFGLVENNHTARFGVRVEMEASALREFHGSNCEITSEELTLGPFGWHGTVVPEDHIDFSISGFRGNEDRWKTDRVSFNLIGNRPFPNQGFEQTNRIGQLSFILSEDRVTREKVSAAMAGKSRLSILPEYGWLPDALRDVARFIPEMAEKAYIHFPTIIPQASPVRLSKTFLTDVPNMYCVGESAGRSGLLYAMLSGIVAGAAATGVPAAGVRTKKEKR